MISESKKFPNLGQTRNRGKIQPPYGFFLAELFPINSIKEVNKSLKENSVLELKDIFSIEIPLWTVTVALLFCNLEFERHNSI